MASGVTPEEYELHLKQLREELRAHLERGQGKAAALLRQAEHVLKLRDEFADIYARYPDIEGMVAEMLARRQQKKFMASPRSDTSPGCLLGWLLGRKSE